MYVVLLVGISIAAVAAFYGYTTSLYAKNQTRASQNVPTIDQLTPIYIAGITYDENVAKGTAVICTVSSTDTNGCTLVVKDAITGTEDVNVDTQTRESNDVYITCGTFPIPKSNRIIVEIVCSGGRAAQKMYTITGSYN